MDHPHGNESPPAENHARAVPRDENADAGHARMMREMFDRTLWTHFANVVLGIWLITSPVTFGYASRPMAWSDVISGALIVLFGLRSVSPRAVLARWGNAFIGIWLLFAPLVFWAPTAAAYLNGTLAGALVIALSVLVPGMPGMKMLPGPDIPPGWSYNPSSWLQRAPIIALAFVGLFISRYLAAYQMGYIPQAWDPVFGEGTRRVLESDVSRAWPISDAGLGAVSYVLEALSGFMGDARRWRTMPWMVLMFGVLVIPLGVTSIVLIILQPVSVGAWCALCLVTALAMIVMVPVTLDEVVAMGQFMAQSRREGKPLWRTFWMGGTVSGGSMEPGLPRFESSPRRTFPAMFRGVNVPWNLGLSAVLGGWLMLSPWLFGSSGAAAHSDHIVGALVITVTGIALAEVGRPLRFVNAAFGAWVMAAPWLLAGGGPAGRWNDLAVGAALIALSFRRGRVEERYGGWNRLIV